MLSKFAQIPLFLTFEQSFMFFSTKENYTFWIRIRIKKAAGSGTAKNYCGSTALAPVRKNGITTVISCLHMIHSTDRTYRRRSREKDSRSSRLLSLAHQDDSGAGDSGSKGFGERRPRYQGGQAQTFSAARRIQREEISSRGAPEVHTPKNN